MKIFPMFSQLPLLLCVYHSVCVDPLMSVSQASYSHRRSLAFDSVSSLGQIQGAHLGEVKCKKRKEDKHPVECSEGCINPTRHRLAERDYAVGCQHVEVITFHLPD